MIDLRDYDIVVVEEQILRMYNDFPFRKPACPELLKCRKRIINNKVLAHLEEILPDLIEFNDAMTAALRELYVRAKTAWENLGKLRDLGESVELTAKCYLSYNYPELHPVQGDDREDLWDALCDFDFNPLYRDGVNRPSLSYPGCLSFDEWIGMTCPPPNWNEGLDRVLTKDLHLTIAFHNLFEHMNFAITDFIYVRHFETEINVEIDKKLV
ncbi:MAG: hypothetical protein J6Y87_05410 [Muribaculaceae bacterium]|nr:hypothetical protein [Muribaculaceae bacterium]